MYQIQEFVDERQKGWCIHCGEWIASVKTSRDHVPSKSLLLKPHPPTLPIVEICKSYNTGFSLDDEYLVAFFGSVLDGSTKPESQANPHATRILQRNPRLRARNAPGRNTGRSAANAGCLEVGTCPDRPGDPEKCPRPCLLRDRPMLDRPEYVRSVPLESLTSEQRDDLENMDFGAGWPEVDSRMMTRVFTGQDLADGWIVVQEGVNRYPSRRPAACS